MSWSFEDTSIGRYLISLRKRKPSAEMPTIAEDKILENPCFGFLDYGTLDSNENFWG